MRVRQTLQQAASYGWRTDMRRLRQSMRLAWKGGKFAPTICLPIDTPPDQANRETGMPPSAVARPNLCGSSAFLVKQFGQSWPAEW